MMAKLEDDVIALPRFVEWFSKLENDQRQEVLALLLSYPSNHRSPVNKSITMQAAAKEIGAQWLAKQAAQFGAGTDPVTLRRRAEAYMAERRITF
jgi:hypothetical protein